MQQVLMPSWLSRKIVKDGDCILWTGAKNGAGYGVRFTSRRDGPRKQKTIHRIVYKICHGSIPDGAHILHSCDRPACVNPAHLRAGTNVENMRDKVERHRQHRPIGIINPRRVLTPNQVVEIKEQAPSGLFAYGQRKYLAEKYGVTGETIRNAAIGRTWAHL